MKKSSIAIIIILALTLFFMISSSEKPKEVPSEDGKIICKSQQRNADACIEIYQPVCGAIDTGIRCITQPCDNLEFKTYSNPCFACSDEDVAYYVEGECL